jgi:2-methylisocitrate lyase-like PEP mutase family enzyme
MTRETTRLAELAHQLRALHHRTEALVLPNAWDAASAQCVAEAGFAAVATTSSGMSAALGFPDGQGTPMDEMFAAIARITRIVSVPVTADIEAGYGLSPDELVARLLEAGVVGCNLEDTDHTAGRTLRDPGDQAHFLSEVKRAARASGVDIVVNARVDVFVRRHTETRADIEEAVARARRYLEAGADCVYPILVREEPSIAELVEGIPGPVNIYAMAGAPDVRRLADLGVRRISLAGRLHRAAMTDLQRRLGAIRDGAWAD